jgi:hypothetical protein
MCILWLQVRLTVGIYHVFLSDWLKIFPKSNILVVKSENNKGPNRYLTQMEIFSFLDLSKYLNTLNYLMLIMHELDLRLTCELDNGWSCAFNIVIC